MLIKLTSSWEEEINEIKLNYQKQSVENKQTLLLNDFTTEVYIFSN